MADRSTMRAEAVEAMCRVDWDRIHPFPHTTMSWDEEPDEIKALYVDNNGALLDALLSPQSVPCSECCRNEPPNYSECAPDQDCETCHGDGQVTSPPLAYLAGELVEAGVAVHADTHEVVIDPISYPAPGEMLFRLRSGEDT